MPQLLLVIIIGWGRERVSEWRFYALSAAKAIFRASIQSSYLFSPVMMMMIMKLDDDDVDVWKKNNKKGGK